MTPMDLIQTLQPEQYQALCNANACGFWPDGRRLTAEQQQRVMQTILLYQAHQDTQEPFTVKKNGEVANQDKPQKGRSNKRANDVRIPIVLSSLD